MALITISRDNFLHNIDCFKNHIEKVNKHMTLAIVLKDNAYGHGLWLMAKLCLESGIKDIFIKNFDELERIKDIATQFNSITCLYGMPINEDFNTDNTNVVIHKISDIDTLKGIIPKREIHIELKVNIGMNRNGLSKDMLIPTFQKALDSNFIVKGVFGHNGFGDNDDINFNKQLQNFTDIKNLVKDFCNKNGIPQPRFHSLNTSGLMRVSKSNEDIARVGIGLYGYSHSEAVHMELKPILRLYAHKITTQRLRRGDSVGYGGTTKIENDIDISTYDIGYGDGFYRVNERRELKTPSGLKILPTSSMDCISVFSNEEKICLMDNAKYIGNVFDTISYEVLTRLSPFIPRKVV